MDDKMNVPKMVKFLKAMASVVNFDFSTIGRYQTDSKQKVGWAMNIAGLWCDAFFSVYFDYTIDMEDRLCKLSLLGALTFVLWRASGTRFMTGSPLYPLLTPA